MKYYDTGIYIYTLFFLPPTSKWAREGKGNVIIKLQNFEEVKMVQRTPSYNSKNTGSRAIQICHPLTKTLTM